MDIRLRRREQEVHYGSPQPLISRHRDTGVEGRREKTIHYSTTKQYQTMNQITIIKPQKANALILSGTIARPNSIIIQPVRNRIMPMQPTKIRQNKTTTIIEKEKDDIVIKGIRRLAKSLGCGVNKAQQIMNSGVLISEKVAYKIGKTWLINREKLTCLLEQNPRIFEKISTEY